jgi:2-amino-4-hydroxy-6-hydroxymethyldihydropteridine diphosphokinase
MSNFSGTGSRGVGRDRLEACPAFLAIVALGSNLGDSPAIIRRALGRLQAFSDRPVLKSSLWQTTPVDCPPGSPPFVNAVIGLVPHGDETPEPLLVKLQSLEEDFGRQPKQGRNEPRRLDLDLIAFGAEIRATPQLALPHPRAHQRRFVLQPLAEIAPDLVLPAQTCAVSTLLRRLKTDEVLCRIDATR